jgi:hypothetical protein
VFSERGDSRFSMVEMSRINVGRKTLEVLRGLTSFYDVPRSQAYCRCIPSVWPGDRPPASCMSRAASYGADKVIDM